MAQRLLQTFLYQRSLLRPDTLPVIDDRLLTADVFAVILSFMTLLLVFAISAVLALRVVFRLSWLRSLLVVLISGLLLFPASYILPIVGTILASPFLLLLIFLLVRGYLVEVGRAQRARESFRQNLEAATLNPADSSAHYNLGLIHQQRGEVDAARERFERAIQIDEDEVDAHYQLGRIARSQKRLPEAIKHFEEVVSRDPAHAQHEIWRSLGENAQRVNEFFRLRMPGPLVDQINRAVPLIVEKVSESLSGFVTGIVVWLAYLPWLILIPILSFFFLKDAETFRSSALQMLPKGRWRWRGDEFFQDVSETLAAYTRAQLTACLFIGVVCALGFALLDLPSSLVMGLIAGIFEFVPLVGPLLIAVLAAFVAGLHAGAFSVLFVLLFLGVLRIVQDYFIYPRLVGQGIHLHPLAVIIAILSGAELAGVAGIFLAIPVVAILTVSYRHWLEHRGSEGFADLLAGEEQLEEENQGRTAQ